MPEWTITVSQLNEYVRKKLAGDALLQSVSVKGEISEYKVHYASGHIYFTLKDKKARIACVMFRSNAERLTFKPQPGHKVIVTGQAGVYPSTGQYQLYAESMKPEGLGSIYERYEQLKHKLSADGLFDEGRKKPLPPSVKTIGVATSASGAAVRDIIRVALSRNPHVNILIAPCQVQGAGAENEIASAIRLLDESGKCDVILVGRGGGSIEDLWPFNEEITVRAIAKSRTPVVSCVGHETDFTLSDFAADKRAATPSNAAEIAVNDVTEQIAVTNMLFKRLDRAIKSAQIHRRMKLEMIAASKCFKDARETFITKRRVQLENLYERMKSAQQNRHEKLVSKLENNRRVLETLNPENVIRHGYSCIRKNGRIITTAADLAPSDIISVQVADGVIDATVNNIEANTYER